MSQTIARMYETHERAEQAAHELRTNRFVQFSDVFVFARHGGHGAGTAGAESTPDGVVARLMSAHVLKAHAKGYAAGILRGGSLVVVHAPFGCGAEATNILESHDPIDSGVPEARESVVGWDDAAPCSSALHMRVLLDDSATFSRFWNVPPLVKSAATTSSALGLPEASPSKGPFAGTFGMSMISNKATIFSSMLGLPVLSKPKSRA
jgi:hypothetical protein